MSNRKASLSISNVPLSELDGLMDCIEACGGVIDGSPQLETVTPTRKKAKIHRGPKRYTRNSVLAHGKRYDCSPSSKVGKIQGVARELKNPFTGVELIKAVQKKFPGEKYTDDSVSNGISQLINRDALKVVKK